MRIKSGLVAAACGLLLASAAAAQTTGVTGGGQPINNYQPSIVLSQTVATQGIFPAHDCPECGAAAFLGQIHTFAGNYGAFGTTLAQGQLLSIAQNTALFSLMGTSYGGNGINTFALPDLAGQAAMGVGQGPGLSSRVLGEEAGSATNIMTLAQLPAHQHGLPGGGVTGTTGGNAPMDNMQPTLALTYGIAVNAPFPSPDGGSGNPFMGEIGLFAGSYVPGGYLPADGRLLSIAGNDALFNLIGTTYGGDGQDTFALPDLRGRVAVGAGGGITLGEVFGGETTTLSGANMPAHDHTLPGGGFTDPAGGGQPFSNYQPSLGLNYLIALQGVFPGVSGGGSWPDQDMTLGEIVAFAGGFAPKGWALAQGQLLSIAQNQALFSILGCTYGGNCQTTFALPDLRGRTIIGSGDGFTVGELLGEGATTLTVDQLAPHDHTLPLAPPPGVPEPSAWALMIAGFGLAGAALRRRRRPAAA